MALPPLPRDVAEEAAGVGGVDPVAPVLGELHPGDPGLGVDLALEALRLLPAVRPAVGRLPGMTAASDAATTLLDRAHFAPPSVARPQSRPTRGHGPLGRLGLAL